MPLKHSIATEKGRDEFFQEWKDGKLHIGTSDQTVPPGKKGQKQAVAIYLSKKERESNPKRKDSSIKSLEGQYLSSRVSPDCPVAYSEAMLEVFGVLPDSRMDAKRRIRVNDPRVKNGFYYREIEDGQGEEEVPAKRGKKKPNPKKISKQANNYWLAASVLAVAAAHAGVHAYAKKLEDDRINEEVRRRAKDREESKRYWEEANARREESHKRWEEARQKTREESRKQWEQSDEEFKDWYNSHFGKPESMQEWYNVLGVKENATPDEIKKAYRLKAREFHPDINKDPSATEMMQKINAAYERLGSRGDSLFLREDARKRIRVNAPHTKKGYYYREQDVSDTPLRSPIIQASRRPPIGAALAGAAIGAALTGGAALWIGREQIKKTVEQAKAEADARVTAETSRVSQALTQKHSKDLESAQIDADSKLASEVAKVKAESEAQIAAVIQKAQEDTQLGIAAEAENVRKQSQSTIDQIQQQSQSEIARITREAEERIRTGIDSGMGAEREAIGQERSAISQEREAIKAKEVDLENTYQTHSSQLEGIYQSRNKALEANSSARSSELERAHQERMLGLEQRAIQLENEYATRATQLERDTLSQLEQRTKQIEQRVNAEKLQEIEKARTQAITETANRINREIQEASDRQTAGSVKPGYLVSSEKGGIELGVSVRRGLDLANTPSDSLRSRFTRAVDSLVSKRHQQALEAMAPELSEQMQQVRSSNRDVKAKWQTAEQVLIQQSNREKGLGAALDDIKKTYRQRHVEELDRFLARAEGRGSYDDDLVSEFDNKLTRFNAEMQREITKAIQETRESIPLDRPFLGGKDRRDAAESVKKKTIDALRPS